MTADKSVNTGTTFQLGLPISLEKVGSHVPVSTNAILSRTSNRNQVPVKCSAPGTKPTNSSPRKSTTSNKCLNSSLSTDAKQKSGMLKKQATVLKSADASKCAPEKSNKTSNGVKSRPSTPTFGDSGFHCSSYPRLDKSADQNHSDYSRQTNFVWEYGLSINGSSVCYSEITEPDLSDLTSVTNESGFLLNTTLERMYIERMSRVAKWLKNNFEPNTTAENKSHSARICDWKNNNVSKPYHATTSSSIDSGKAKLQTDTTRPLKTNNFITAKKRKHSDINNNETASSNPVKHEEFSIAFQLLSPLSTSPTNSVQENYTHNTSTMTALLQGTKSQNKEKSSKGNLRSQPESFVSASVKPSNLKRSVANTASHKPQALQFAQPSSQVPSSSSQSIYSLTKVSRNIKEATKPNSAIQLHCKKRRKMGDGKDLVLAKVFGKLKKNSDSQSNKESVYKILKIHCEPMRCLSPMSN